MGKPKLLYSVEDPVHVTNSGRVGIEGRHPHHPRTPVVTSDVAYAPQLWKTAFIATSVE